MNKPVLVVMAAGLGSRYGGLKQIDPVGANNQLIIDYSIYDAKLAGFETVIFIINHKIEKTFKEAIGNRLSKYINVKYAFQELDNIPEEFSVPEGRIKPWGTCHAIMSAADLINGPFAVINSDDFYGRKSFKIIYDFLLNTQDDDIYHYAMVSYLLKNTVTENGHVARGVCVCNKEKKLVTVNERTHIESLKDGIAYTEDDGNTWIHLDDNSLVSMNLWGFSKSFLNEAQAGFPVFLKNAVKTNPLKGEYFLPSVVNKLLEEKKADVKVLETDEKWYGVTYSADKENVVKAIAKMTSDGIYPENLWEK